MLNRLVIKNVALIENAEIEFHGGFNVLSGETGAGKSVVLESINFVLGAKADRTLIRTGTSECSVVAEFDTENNKNISAILEEMDIEADNVLLISRKLTDGGKNSVKINGVPVTVGMLKNLTSLLIDVHGQSEHFYLLNAGNQLKLLDEFSGEDCEKVKADLKTVYAEYKNALSELASLGGTAADRAIRLDVLNYQINEIEKADIKENEFEELSALKEQLQNREKILTALNGAKSCLFEEGGASDLLSNAVRTINAVSSFDAKYGELSERLNGIYADIDDVISSIGDSVEELSDADYDIAEVEERLKVIKNVFKKYGGDLNAVNDFSENAVIERDKLEKADENAEKTGKLIEELKHKLFALYGELSAIRQKSAKIFASNVTQELKELGMGKANFYIDFSPAPDFENCSFGGANGYDKIEFMFSANLGEPAKNLAETISGGEISRFMLAIKAQTAKYNDISTFIFDEIDAGISGVIARIVAEKLYDISRSAQVIAVSHLPQIASFADDNILIEKTELTDKTVTTVKTLDATGKVKEIERLLGALKNETFAEKHAEALISSAEEYKKSKKI